MESLPSREHGRNALNYQYSSPFHSVASIRPSHQGNKGICPIQWLRRYFEGNDRHSGYLYRLGVHEPGQSHTVYTCSTHLRDAARHSPPLRGLVGHSRCSWSRLFRVYRLRRGFYGSPGSEKSEARHADRYSRLAGNLHGSLRTLRLRLKWCSDYGGFPLNWS